MTDTTGNIFVDESKAAMAFPSTIIACFVLLWIAAAVAEPYKAVTIQLKPPTGRTSPADFAMLKPRHAHMEGLVDAPHNVTSKIVAGIEAEPHKYKYQAALVIDGSYFCGGSLISTKWILTAASCAYEATSIEVTLGAHNITKVEDTQVSVPAILVVIHESFSSIYATYDVALVQLSTEVTLNDVIDVIPLADLPDGTYEGEYGELTGWGVTSDSSEELSPVLNWIQLTILSNHACRDQFGPPLDGVIFYEKICTWGAGGRGGCRGDSGSPLVSSGKQVGIVSFGSEYCQDQLPTAYSRITIHREWIFLNSGV